MKYVYAFSAFLLGSLAATPLMATGDSTIQTSVQSFVGTWGGPFGGQTWIIEIFEDGETIGGRYKMGSDSGWVDLQEMTYADGVLEFQFKSARKAPMRFELNPSGDALVGTYNSDSFPPIPLTFNRVR